jgi:RimJ/RimL family protein N-acetyltransferase
MDELRSRFAWLRRRGTGNVIDDNGRQAEHHEPGPDVVGELVREGDRIRLRRHVVQNREAFQRWYADPEIARLLRHDQRPLNELQSRSYFDTLIMPSSARGTCFAIHEIATDRLIGTTALTDFEGSAHRTAYFRIVIGEKDSWGLGYGTEATKLVMAEAFESQNLDAVKLEVFTHNERAERAYLRVGFVQTGQHIEWVGREKWELHVLEMKLERERFYAFLSNGTTPAGHNQSSST